MLSFGFPATQLSIYFANIKLCESLLFSMLDFTLWSTGRLLLLSCFGVACVCARVCSDKDMWVFCWCYFSHTVINCYLCVSIYFRFLCWCHLCDSPPGLLRIPCSELLFCVRANCIEGSEEQYIHTEMPPYLWSIDLYDNSYLGRHDSVPNPRNWSDTFCTFLYRASFSLHLCSGWCTYSWKIF
jgi:hypothetical protein